MRNFNTFRFFSLLLGILLSFFVFHFFGVSVLDHLKFLLGIIIIVYIPGRSLCRLAKLNSGRLETVTLALVAGMVTSTFIYKFSRMFHLEFIFFIWLLLSAIYFLGTLVKRRPEKKDFSFKISPVGIILSVIFILVFIMLSVDNFRNGRQQPDGSVVVNMHYYDGFIRNAVVREVSHSIPPQMPFASGQPLSYHYGMDIFISIFYRHLGLGVLDLIHRFSLSFFFVILILSLFIFIRELTSSDKTALVGVFLIIFGSGGLAYMATYFLGVHQIGSLFYSFYLFNLIGTNSFLPVIAIMMTGFFCLSRYLRTRKLSWFWFAALLFALALEYKMFFFGPIIGALFLSGLITAIFKRDFALLKVLGCTSLLACPLLLSAYLSNKGGPQYTFDLKFIDWIRFSLRELKLISLQTAWGDLIHRSQFRIDSVMAVFPAVIVFFMGSFGWSFISIPSMLKEFFSFKKTQPLRLLLISFFGGCVLYFFCINMSFEGRPRNFVNIYVYYFGLIVLFVFWTEKMVKFAERKKKFFQIIFISLVILLSVPNTVRHLRIKYLTPQPKPFPATFFQAAAWMNDLTESETVVLHPLYLRHACYFMDRRVVLDDSSNSFLTWHLSASELEKRKEDIERFFIEPRLNADVLEIYNVSYLLAYNEDGFLGNADNHLSQISCFVSIGGEKTQKYKKSYELDLVFKNKDYVIFQVTKIPLPEQEVFTLEKQEGKLLFNKFKIQG